jgi:AGZA family xanthine/uracil permease-like MFS transporter
MVERLFRLSENKTNLRTEVLAGLTTFLTMASLLCEAGWASATEN